MTAELEDEFGDVIGKARRGLGLDVAAVTAATGIDADDLHALEAYERAPARTESDGLAAVLELAPAALWDIAADGWRPEPYEPSLTGRARVVSLPFPPMRVTMYVVGDADTSAALIIDPGATAPRILQTLTDEGWTAAGILITHADGDHVGALEAVCQGTGAPVWVHIDERPRIRGVNAAQVHELDGDTRFSVGPFDVEALETPGHAAGHTAFALRDAVFVGDALFAGSVGGTALGAAHYANHLATVRDKILHRAAGTKLFAGHGPPTTVQAERGHNPFFAAQFGA